VSNVELDNAKVDEWLAPLPDESEPCGKDLEYDNDYLELQKAALGKPETQFGPGEPPDWRDVSEKSAALLDRSRDLRIALLWVRAQINLSGFSALSGGLRLIEGLVANFWDHLHPLPDPDDQDPYARANALAILPQSEGLLGDVRQCAFFDIRSIGELRLRAIEIALGQMSARADETPLSRDQISQMVASAVGQDPSLAEQPGAALAQLASLATLLTERFGAEAAPDLKPLVALLKNVRSVLPVAEGALEEESGEESAQGAAMGGARLSGAVRSREEAVRAIDMVCEFLERTEPTNPAQLMLRRARKMINHNFLQLMKELAPDALKEVARVMGVDPESVMIDTP
jgi:type VI secretion system protein ImpA